jgi:hypothetical protein
MKQMLGPSTAEKYLSEQLGKAETVLTLKNIVIAGLILLVADALSTFILQNLYPSEVAPGTEVYLGMVSGFIDYALFFYITAYVLYLVAKVLGGKGVFKEQMYLQSVVAVAISLIQGVLVVLSSLYIPEDVLLLSLFSLPLLFAGMYSVYMDYKIIKVAHKLNSAKAALSIIGFWIAIFAVIFILYAGLYMFTGQTL